MAEINFEFSIVARLRSRATSKVAVWRMLKFCFIEGPYAHFRAILKSSELKVIREHRGRLRRARVVVVILIRDEVDRLPFLFSYYRDRGADHFLVVDNQSSDGTLDFLRSQTDVSCFLADGPYRDARYGCDWINWLLSTRCRGKWILWVDADEHIVFPLDEWNRSIPHALNDLDGARQRSVQGLMVDMYSDRRPRDNVIERGEDPQSVCNLFDSCGYSLRRDPVSRTTWVSGGVRRRLFFPQEPDKAPVLNKTPLVRWQGHYAFLKSTHQLWPARLNESGPRQLALLHFKFTSVSSDKVGDHANRAQHTAEYERYGSYDEVSYLDSRFTARYSGAVSLVECGLMEPWMDSSSRRTLT